MSINEHILRKYKEVIFIKNKMTKSKKTKIKNSLKNDKFKCGYETDGNDIYIYYLGKIYVNITEDEFNNIIDNICHICEDDETEHEQNKIICYQCKNKFCEDCNKNMVYSNFLKMEHVNKCPYCKYEYVEFNKELIIYCINRKINEMVQNNENTNYMLMIRREIIKIFLHVPDINTAINDALSICYHIINGGSVMFNINKQTGEKTVIFIDESDDDDAFLSDYSDIDIYDYTETPEQINNILSMQTRLKIEMRLHNKNLHIMKYKEFLKNYNKSIRTKNGLIDLLIKIVDDGILIEPYTYTELLNIINNTNIFNLTDEEPKIFTEMLNKSMIWHDIPDDFKQHY